MFLQKRKYLVLLYKYNAANMVISKISISMSKIKWISKKIKYFLIMEMQTIVWQQNLIIFMIWHYSNNNHLLWRERKIPVPRKVWIMYLYSLYSKLSACKAYILRNSEDEPLKSIIKQYNLIDFQCIDKFLCLLVFFLIRWQWKLFWKRSCNNFEKLHVYI